MELTRANSQQCIYDTGNRKPARQLLLLLVVVTRSRRLLNNFAKGPGHQLRNYIALMLYGAEHSSYGSRRYYDSFSAV